MKVYTCTSGRKRGRKLVSALFYVPMYTAGLSRGDFDLFILLMYRVYL